MKPRIKVLYVKNIDKKMRVGRAARKTVDSVDKRASRYFNKVKKEFLDRVRQDEVMQELSQGADGPNITGTLGERRGNLFSFMGLVAGSNPDGALLDFLEEKIDYVKDHQIKGRGNKTFVLPRITFPNRAEFLERSALRLPWESGRSWVWAVEEGISNLGSFIAITSWENSRSKGGMQIKKDILPGEYQPTGFMSNLYAWLVKRWKGGSAKDL